MKLLYKIVLIVGCLAIGSYLFMRFYLERDVKKNSQQSSSHRLPATDTTTQKPSSVLDLQPLFVAKMKQMVKDGSKGLYDLSIDSMSLDELYSSS